MDYMSRLGMDQLIELRHLALRLNESLKAQKQGMKKCLKDIDDLDYRARFHMICYLTSLAYESKFFDKDVLDNILFIIRHFRDNMNKHCTSDELCDFLYIINRWVVERQCKEFVDDVTVNWFNGYFDVFLLIEVTSSDSFVRYWSLRFTLSIVNAVLTRFLQSFVYTLDFERSKMEQITESIQTLIFVKLGNIQDFRSRWFGGLNKLKQTAYDDCITRLFILIRVKCRVILISKSSAFENDDFTNSLDLDRIVDLFMDQDDQLCEYLFCDTVLAERNLARNSHELLFRVLNNLNWTYDVLLDWIISPETMFLPYFIRYLKLASISTPNLILAANSLKLYRKTSNYSFKSQDLSQQSLTLKVVELIGDERKIREIIVRPLDVQKSIKDHPSSEEKVDILPNFFAVLMTLLRKIDNLNDNKLIGFNANYLLKVLRLFLDKLDEFKL